MPDCDTAALALRPRAAPGVADDRFGHDLDAERVLNCSVSQSEFVSIFDGVSSSEPTAMIRAFSKDSEFTEAACR